MLRVKHLSLKRKRVMQKSKKRVMLRVKHLSLKRMRVTSAEGVMKHLSLKRRG